MHQKIKIFLFSLMLILESCVSWQDIKAGITGEKRANTDEFLVEKKDPLIQPPNFENLPIPGLIEDDEQASENSLETLASEGDESFDEDSTTGSTESNILKRIKKN